MMNKSEMRIHLKPLQAYGYLEWPSILAWASFALIVFQVALLSVTISVFSSTALVIRSIYVFAVFIASIIVMVSSFKLSGKRHISAILMTIALFISGLVDLFQNIAYIINIPRVNIVTEISFMVSYLLAIVAVGVYFEWKLAWLGSVLGVVLDSVIVGYTTFVFVSDLLPKINHNGMWTPHLDGYLAIDVGILFALFVVVIRYGRGGGPVLTLGVVSMLCLLLGDIIFTYFLHLSPLLAPLAAAPLYSLNAILIGLSYYRGIYRPPQIQSHQGENQPKLDWFIWVWIPRQMLFLAFVKIAIDAGSHAERIIPLLALGLVHESMAMVDYRRVNKHMYSIYTREQQARELIQQQKAVVEASNQRLRASMMQAEDLAIEQERVRVAREIHDGLGHHLNNAKVHVAVARRYFDTDRAISLDSLLTTQSEISTAQQELRRAVEALVSDGFSGSLEELLVGPVRDCQLAGIDATLHVEGSPVPLSQQITYTLYRISQEALSNIRQHSCANQASVQIHYQDDCIRLVIDDDGIGIPASTQERRGHGLDNLQERATLVGGKTIIETRPGQGVRVLVEVPICTQ